MSIYQRYMPDIGHNIWKRDSRSVDPVLILRVELCGTSLSRLKVDICELVGSTVENDIISNSARR